MKYIEIERLKELKQQVFDDYQLYEVKMQNSFEESMKEVTPTGEMDDDGKDLAALIDAEIARKSVTSEEVQEAIKELMYGSWQSSKDGYPITLGDKTIELAITALQEYRPLAKVSEGLPPENELRNGMVLAWSTELDEWQVENWGYVKDRPDDYTHWKPLPEAPKGE